MKILRVIARLNTGGPAKHTILLTRGFNGGRFSSRLVTGVVNGAEGDMGYYAAEAGVVPLVIPELSQKIAVGNDLKAFWRLLRVMRVERPDIIHTHTAKAGALGRVAALVYNFETRLRGGRPALIVHTFHGHLFDGYFSRLTSRLLGLIERVLALGTDRIVAVSERVKRDLICRYRICRADKVVVVPLGLDFSWARELMAYTGDLRRAFGIAPEVTTIGVVGRLTAVKNHALLLRAASLLRRSDVRIVFVGDGELRGELERFARARGLDGFVIFVGWLREPARIYSDLDIACLPSRNEGTPVALIEAMAAGKPVVATRVGGVPDLMIGKGRAGRGGFEVFDNGVLVPPEDSAPLAAALEYLIDAPDLRRAMGAAGAAAIVSRFSEVRLLRDMERVYDELIGQANGRSGCDR